MALGSMGMGGWGWGVRREVGLEKKFWLAEDG